MLSETDRYLVDKIREGDYHAFEALFKFYYRFLVGIARLYVSREEVAEDIVQDLFVKIWEQPSILNINVSLKGYLCRSIYNSSLNYILRRQQRFKNLDQHSENRLKELLHGDPADSPETIFELSELVSALRDSVSHLPPECGRIFRMSREEGLSNKEIAEKLNISENTVKVQIHRALSRVKEALSEFRK
ncbi:MAG: RNA polymerase sigma-70 factor [Bacteroidota bacterium]